MKKPNVSIIIPVYNGKNYVKRCLETVINQSLKNIEIIIVNDGSDDGTIDILNLYKKKDERIRIISKKNEGLYKARLDGISAATGEYVGFVDSDDRVDSMMFEKMYNIASTCGYDVVNCNYYIEDEKGNCKLNFFNDLDLHKNSEIIKEYFSYHSIKEMMWSKLFKKSIFDDYEYIKNISTAEDYLIFSKILYKVRSLYNLNEPLYYYFKRSDSIMNSVFSDKKMNRLYSGEEVREFYLRNSPELLKYCSMNLCFIIIYIYSDIENKEYKKKYYKLLCKKYKLYYIEAKKVFGELSLSKKTLLVGFKYFPGFFSYIYKIYRNKRSLI